MLIHNWGFEDADGSTLADGTGSLTFDKYGTVTKVAGVVGDCGRFNGSTGYYRRASINKASLTSFSVSVWFRTSATAVKLLYNQYGFMSIQTDANGCLIVVMNTDAVFTSATAVSDGQWHHLAITTDTTTA